MSIKLTRQAYEQLIAEDLAALAVMPDSPERAHIEHVLKDSIACYYPPAAHAPTPPAEIRGGSVIIPAIPGTRLRINGDGTVDRLYSDGRIARAQGQIVGAGESRAPEGPREEAGACAASHGHSVCELPAGHPWAHHAGDMSWANDLSPEGPQGCDCDICTTHREANAILPAEGPQGEGKRC